nr:hypothetical protein CFP56_47055 [Quercus suber]
MEITEYLPSKLYDLKIQAELMDEVAKLYVDDNNYTYRFKCKNSECPNGSIQMEEGHGRPYTKEDFDANKYATLMRFRCLAFEPFDFEFGNGWTAETSKDGVTLLLPFNLTGGSQHITINGKAAFVGGMEAIFDIVNE